MVLAVLAAVGLASPANAAFATGKCSGADITGRGASFARDAHNIFINNFKPVYCAGTPKLASVTYEALGSGAGRDSMKVREVGGPRFGMTDEPPSVLEVQQMNTGVGPKGDPAKDNANTGDDGQIHVIPAAVGAVPPLVNFPNGCDVSKLDAASRTPEQNLDGDATPDDVIRVLFTKAEFESIWEKESTADTWHEVFPELAGEAACEKPIIRVVRFDDSGTTFTFKDYLHSIDGAEGWLTTYVPSEGAKSREWPNATFGLREDCPKVVVGGVEVFPSGPGADSTEASNPGPDQLTSGCANGNGSLVAKLVATDGSIGYSDISTARSNNPSLAITPEGNDNDTYWTQVQNGSNAFTEPTSNPNGFRTDGPKGANCLDTTFTSVPGTTLGDWSKASGVNSAEGFGICTLTYGLVFDDNADAWGNSPAEEAKARTVKDYWENIVSAQASLFPGDYAPLPPAILATAKAGVASIDWNKGQGGGGKEEGGGKVTPPVNNPGGNPQPVKPSNVFSLLRKSISSKTGGATVSVKLPGAGALEMVGTAKKGKKTIKVGRTVLSANQAGTFNLALKPSAAAKQILRESGKLTVKIELTFTPNGGDESDSTSSLTLKLAKKGK